MKFLSLSSAALAALFLASGSASLPVGPNDEQGGPSKPGSEPTCEEFGDKNKHHAKELWDESHVSEMANKFIAKNGVENWVQKLDMQIFENDVSDSWDCWDYDSICQLDKSCPDYDKAGYASAYYLFYSVQSARAYFNSFHTYLQDNTIRESLDIPQIVKDLEVEKVWTPNVFALMAACMGMASGALAGVGPASGVAGFFSGLYSLIANAVPPDEEPGDNTADLALRVQQAFETANKKVDEITGAMFGKKGYDQDLIPSEMLSNPNAAHPAVSALDGGRWLMPHPTESLDKSMENMYHQMKQALAWTMIRRSRKGFVYVQTGMKEEYCGSDPKKYLEIPKVAHLVHDATVPSLWDEKLGGCVSLRTARFDITPTVEMEEDIQKKLFASDGKYRLNPQEVFRNAYDCWVNNGGKIKNPGSAGVPSDDSLPDCFFGITVVKGTSYKNAIVVEPGFPNYKNEHYFDPDAMENPDRKNFDPHKKHCQTINPALWERCYNE